MSDSSNKQREAYSPEPTAEGAPPDSDVRRNDDIQAKIDEKKFEEPQESNILMNYPSPVPLSSVLAEVARWSDYNIVMEPSLNRPIQIFAPNKMTSEQAFSLLVASLQTIGLRVVQIDGSVIKIVPANLGKISA